MIEGIKRCKEPTADRCGTRGRKLLPADDSTQAGKPWLAPAQRKCAGLFRNRPESRVGDNELGKTSPQVGFGMEKTGH